MTDVPQGIRLSKVAKEFNIGLQTIVDFLGKKGHRTELNPNAKITPAMYDLLVKEFQTEKSAKEESLKIGMNFDSKKETVSLKDTKPAAKERELDDEPEELLIKDTKSSAITRKEVFRKEEPELKSPKVLGKMDVAPVTPKAKEPKVKEPEVKVEKTGAKKSDTEEKTKTKKVEEEVKEIKEVKESREAKEIKETKEVKETKETKETKEKKATKKEEVVAEETIIKPEPEEPVVEKKETPPIEKKHKKHEEKEPEIVVEAEQESKIKVIGKIDLDSMNTKTRPDKKTKAEKEDEKKKKISQKKNKPSGKKEEQPAIREEFDEEYEDDIQEELPEITEEIKEVPDNFLPTERRKLDGPTILGRMELPAAKELHKKPAGSSSEDSKNKKRKRKRIKKDFKVEAVPDPTPKKPKIIEKRHLKKDRPKNEVSEDDVQKQIKETLARLSGTGKSKASKYRRQKRETASQQMQEQFERDAEDQKIIKVTEFVTANELGTMMNVPVTQIIATCMNLGLFVSINQRMDAETLSIIAEEFGYKVEFVSVDVQEAIREDQDDPKDLLSRAPIVTVMGHVDHGKTSLLDYVRKANVIAGEAGGITQHIGAYEVTLENGKKITFLDTPGHEAFTAMRARGAKITDIVIVVVAAEESVMPQTIEAINHAQAANVPLIFAINKIDKPNANPEKIKEQLANMNFLVEDWGGKYQSQEISAKKGVNVELLLEKILLEAELLELKANPSKNAVGTVIESSLDKGRGYLATILVQNGSLRIGDMLLAGCTYGRVKAMFNERNQPVKEAGPSTPVLILGLNGAPQAGDKFNVMDDEHEVKNIATKRLQLQREQGLRTQKHITLDEIGRRIAIGDFKELNLIIKGDVDGSIEALTDALLKQSTVQVQVNVIHKSVGQITESDVLLASASNAIIIGFQVRPSMSARKLAEQEQIDIRLYSVIYNAINELKSAIEGMLAPEIEEKIICNLEIRDVFKITKVGTVAGCMVLDGKISRSTKIRLIRDGIVVYTGELGSLKRFKDDVREVATGYECGLNITNFNDIKVGDIIEGYDEVEVKRKL